jgi:hypothetical protein
VNGELTAHAEHTYTPRVWIDQSSSPDTDVFFSTVATVTSALVGFLGGFFVMRLQAFAEEWRKLQFELARYDREDRDIASALARSKVSGRGSGETERLEAAKHSLDQRYMALLAQRMRARMPAEVPVQLVLLLGLVACGVIVPLLAISGPSSSLRVEVIVPVVALLLIMWAAMFGIAWNALRRLRKTP